MAFFIKRLFLHWTVLGLGSHLIWLPALGQETTDTSNIVSGHNEVTLTPLGPANISLELDRASVGFSNGYLLAVHKGNVFRLDVEARGRWEALDSALPLSNEIIVTASNGVALFLSDGENLLSLECDPDSGDLSIDSVVDLPGNGLEAMAASGQNLYLAGTSLGLWKLNFAGDGTDWKQLPIPKEQFRRPALAIQRYTDVPQLFLFGMAVDTGHIAVWRLDDEETVWEITDSLDLPQGVADGVALSPAGYSHIWAVPQGYHEGQVLYAYHTVTRTWVPFDVSRLGWGSLNTILHSEPNDQDIALFSNDGETKAFSLRIGRVDTMLRVIDGIVIIVYLGLTVLLGWYFARRNRTILDFFRGGQRVPFWASSLSLIASDLSALTIMAIPAMVFATNWQYYLMQMGQSLSIWIAGIVVVPLLHSLNIMSMPEYIGQRLGNVARVVAATQQVVTTLLTAGVILVLPSLMISAVTGVDLALAIIVMGALSTVYTILGGLEAVIWTDVAQIIVFVGGTFLAVVLIFFDLDSGLAANASTLWVNGKLKLLDFEFNYTEITFWALLMTVPQNVIVNLGRQEVLQRFISNPSVREAKRSAWAQFVISIGVVAVFYLFGSALYLFYLQNPENLVIAAERQEELVPFFIVHELPVGISGIMLAAVIAATMSTLDTRIHSQATLVVRNLYQPFVRGATDDKAFKVARWVVGIFGAFVTTSALYVSKYANQSMFELMFDILAITSGYAAWILLGILTKRFNQFGALVSWPIVIVFNLILKMWLDVNFLLIGMASLVASGLIGYGVSLWVPEKRQIDLTGLTWWTPLSSGKHQ